MYNFKIIITKNNKKVKLLKKYVSEKTALKKINELVKENKNVLFEKKIVNTFNKNINKESLITVDYEILLLKKRSDSDKNRFIRDDYGRVIEEKLKSNDWVIIEKYPWKIEESFWVFGYDRARERFTIKDIVKNLILKDIQKRNYTTQILVLYNKLIIQKDDDLEIIFCKNENDCKRLHNKLMEACTTSKIDKILFSGVIDPLLISEYYDLIQEKTGWNRTAVMRYQTRH